MFMCPKCINRFISAEPYVESPGAGMKMTGDCDVWCWRLMNNRQTVCYKMCDGVYSWQRSFWSSRSTSLTLVEHCTPTSWKELTGCVILGHITLTLSLPMRWVLERPFRQLCFSTHSTRRYGVSESGPRGSAVERQSLASVLSPYCARPVADGWPLNVGKPSTIGQPTRPTQHFILSGSINE